jgi:hypothetical protein
MVKIIKHTEKAGYLTWGYNTLNENDKAKVSELKWGSEIVYHLYLRGGSKRLWNQ